MTIAQAAEDIRSMRVRGAALIGRHAAKALGEFGATWDGDLAQLDGAAKTLVDARPTAVSLPNAVAFVVRRAKGAAATQRPQALREAAAEFDRRAADALAQIGRVGAQLIPEGGTVLTICNSQGALTPMMEARKLGRSFEAIALETRPWRQGLLTAKQLAQAGVDVSIAVDSAMGILLDEADVVLVGADTLARNGDVVNKVGTSVLSELAHGRDVPVYCCAETFKLHPAARDGKSVPIEERESAEVVKAGELPAGVEVRNPVFDITSHRFVSAYVTEVGRLRSEQLVAAAKRAWDIG